jgi:hypothetical protein
MSHIHHARAHTDLCVTHTQDDALRGMRMRAAAHSQSRGRTCKHLRTQKQDRGIAVLGFNKW